MAVLVCLASLACVQAVHAEPTLHDRNLTYERYADLCCGLTGMEFIDESTMLVLQKSGEVMVIRDGVLQKEPVLEVDTISAREAGLLGIAAVDSTVYLYHTEIVTGQDSRSEIIRDVAIYRYDTEPVRKDTLINKIYKYTWNGESLVDPVLLKELPANWYHNGGVMIDDENGQVYAVIGDAGRYGPLQNKGLDGLYPPGIIDYMDTGVIMRVAPEGPYYAVGVRNSFGLAIDPVTGIMWATENGDDDYDEINMIPDGFNSGWIATMGPATESQLERMVEYEDYVYSDPEFSWKRTVAPTGIDFAEFEETDRYNDSVFVGDCNKGTLYRFQLNQARDGFAFSNTQLQDLVLDERDAPDEIIAGTGFGCITDIMMGPDGYLYLADFIGSDIYRIIPAMAAAGDEPAVEPPPDAYPSRQAGSLATAGDEPAVEPGGGCLIATAAYGTELAPQVQLLREIRDDRLLHTASGALFVSGFNQFYYSFSPTVADWEREHPALREATKYVITPMLYSLSLMMLADGDSELQIQGLGIAVILLNVAMYIAAPAAAVRQIRRCRIRARQEYG